MVYLTGVVEIKKPTKVLKKKKLVDQSNEIPILTSVASGIYIHIYAQSKPNFWHETDFIIRQRKKKRKISLTTYENFDRRLQIILDLIHLRNIERNTREK